MYISLEVSRLESEAVSETTSAMSKNLALGCVAVSWMFAVSYSYTYYQKNVFKNAAVEGNCRIVNMKLWEEGEGECDERGWSDKTLWDKPCKVDVEVTHKGYHSCLFDPRGAPEHAGRPHFERLVFVCFDADFCK